MRALPARAPQRAILSDCTNGLPSPCVNCGGRRDRSRLTSTAGPFYLLLVALKCRAFATVSLWILVAAVALSNSRIGAQGWSGAAFGALPRSWYKSHITGSTRSSLAPSPVAQQWRSKSGAQIMTQRTHTIMNIDASPVTSAEVAIAAEGEGRKRSDVACEAKPHMSQVEAYIA